jgi:hypothetical protein
MHTHKEKDLLRKYLGEHWRKLEDDFFRPVKTTDLLTLEYLRVSDPAYPLFYLQRHVLTAILMRNGSQ